jgi:hypothetical protein
MKTIKKLKVKAVKNVKSVKGGDDKNGPHWNYPGVPVHPVIGSAD